ncbi:MAG: amidohydrolase family protein, partial [Myxococcales bacterium]|nr:amidohydrolase family protein [Myxococcales bacterium]
MRRMLLLASLAACGPKSATSGTAPPSAGPPVAATLAFEDVRVFDGETFVDGVTVLVDGDRIVAVGPGLPIPAGARRVPGAGATLLPGLIDAHTHVQDPAQLAAALDFGVTTEVDMFTLPPLAKSLRAQQAAGEASDRADVVSAGILATAPGGHGTEYGLAIPTLTAPDQAARFVDDRLAEGSDFIKIVYDDGSAYGRAIPTLDPATLRAVIEAAHARDVLAVVHVASQREALEAIEAGADGLAHLFLDEAPREAFVAAARERGVFVTDTLPVLHSLCDGTRGAALADDPSLRPWLDPVQRRALSQRMGKPTDDCAHALAAARALHQAGVRVLASTDAPNAGTTHGASLHDDLALLVDAGLSPTAALRAATADPAEVFGLGDRGRIAAGKRADLVLVQGDPGADITATRDIVGVWKAGVAADREARRARVAEQWEQVERAKRAPPPAGLAAGLVSDFEGGELLSEFGAGWLVSTDAMIGGASTAELRVVDGVLQIEGTIDEASLPRAWAGAMFFPGERPMGPANLSS